MVEVRRLLWNSWNVRHIARHEVTPEEVEQICHRDHTVLAGHTGRIVLIGVTKGKRTVAVILESQGTEGVYYPVTARPASRKERHYYQQQKGGEDTNEQQAA